MWLKGDYSSCSWCGTAFSNVWLANLTWFQIVSGDGWSTLGRELVEAHPWTYIFFVSNIFIVMWGLLNLIVAAIVESNIQARDDDVVSAAKMAERLEGEAFTRFANICRSMDSDGNGEVTIDEFKEFLSTSMELKNNLTVMGVHEDNLEGLLKLIDEDRSGTLDSTEFVKQFTRMRTLVLRTEVFYLVKYVENIQSTLHRQEAMIHSLEETLTKQRIDGLNISATASADSPESLIANLFEKPNTTASEGAHATFDIKQHVTAPVDGSGTTLNYNGERGNAKACPQIEARKRLSGVQRDLMMFTEELDKRINVILQRCDQLPMAITKEVLKSVHVCYPGDVRTGTANGAEDNVTMPFAKSDITTADNFEQLFTEAHASPCRPTFSRVPKPELVHELTR